MMRSLDSEAKSSKYQQVAVAVAKRIADGDYEVGEKLKSRSTVASTLMSHQKQHEKRLKYFG